LAAPRRLRSQVILTQHWEQRNPDHAATSYLVADAAFVVGLRNYRRHMAPAFRPRRLVYALPTSEAGRGLPFGRGGRDRDRDAEVGGHRRF
jgi:LmbE family N-acetylglucosaminyl deacetylase